MKHTINLTDQTVMIFKASKSGAFFHVEFKFNNELVLLGSFNTGSLFITDIFKELMSEASESFLTGVLSQGKFMERSKTIKKLYNDVKRYGDLYICYQDFINF